MICPVCHSNTVEFTVEDLIDNGDNVTITAECEFDKCNSIFDIVIYCDDLNTVEDNYVKDDKNDKDDDW